MKTKQSGSAHVAVVTVLVIALVAALIFIFWQNYADKDSIKEGAPAVSTHNEVKHDPLLKFASWNVEILKDESSVKDSMYQGYDYEFVAVHSGDTYNIYSIACDGHTLGVLSRSEEKQANTSVVYKGMNYNFKPAINECPGASDSTSGKDANTQLTTALSVFEDSLKTVRSTDS